jgi:hypothetical protein
MPQALRSPLWPVYLHLRFSVHPNPKIFGGLPLKHASRGERFGRWTESGALQPDDSRLSRPQTARPARLDHRLRDGASGISGSTALSARRSFKDTGVKGRLRLLVESESFLNDGVAAMLFALVLAWAQATGEFTTPARVASRQVRSGPPRQIVPDFL